MSKSLLYLLTITGVVLLIILGIGVRLGPEVNTNLSFLLPESENFVFDIYTDILKYPNRKRNLETIEILESRGSQVIRWRENYQNNKWREYELVGKFSPYYFDYKIYGSSSGNSSEISVSFNENSGFTEVKMFERGKIDNIFLRGLRFLIGDNYYLKTEAKWLRVAILQDQIQRK